MGFGVAANTSGMDYAHGFMRAAAKLLAGKQLGKLPVKFQAGVDYDNESNDAFGRGWAAAFSVTPVVPHLI